MEVITLCLHKPFATPFDSHDVHYKFVLCFQVITYQRFEMRLIWLLVVFAIICRPLISLLCYTLLGVEVLSLNCL